MSLAEYLPLLKKIQAVVFDFDGVFTDNRVIVSEDGKESVICSRADGYGLQVLRELGIKAVVLSSEVNPVCLLRAQKLHIECYNAIENKKNSLMEWISINDISLEQVAFVGNDCNDIECLKSVGCAVVPSDAWPEAIKESKIVLEKRGGYGAVREFCEMLKKSREDI